MKICITAEGDNLESRVDPRFGRCAFFILLETETMEFEAVRNSQAAGGAGIQSGNIVVDKEAKVLLTGNIGPNAFQVLQAAGIEIVTGISGTVQQAVDKFNSGEIKSTGGPNVDAHFGMKP